MKLLFCNSCQSIFSLSFTEKKCDCGETSGKYIDDRNAIFSGNAMMIGFDNTEFREALGFKGLSFKAFTIKEPCFTFKRSEESELIDSYLNSGRNL